MTWQPIETAPKNPAGIGVGPWILIWSVTNNHIYQARWVTGQYGGHWRQEGGCYVHGYHWMPLPAPPTKEQGTE